MDNFGIMGSIDRQRYCIDQTHKVAGVPDFLQLSLLFEPVGQCDKVDGFCFVKQVDNGGIDFLVGGAVKILRGKYFDNVQQGSVVDQNGTDDRLLRVDILRWKRVLGEIFLLFRLMFGHVKYLKVGGVD